MHGGNRGTSSPIDTSTFALQLTKPCLWQRLEGVLATCQAIRQYDFVQDAMINSTKKIIMSCHITSNITSYHITSYHMTPYDIISHPFLFPTHFRTWPNLLPGFFFINSPETRHRAAFSVMGCKVFGGAGAPG